MRYHEDGHIYLNIQEWQDSGLSMSNLKVARHRGQVVTTRASKNKPTEIQYDTLPDRFKEKIRGLFGDPHEHIREEILNTYRKCDSDAYTYYESRGLAADVTRQLIKKVEWINLLNALDYGLIPDKIALDLTSDGYKGYLKLIKENNVPLPNSHSGLRKVLKAYREQGYEALINGRLGISNAAKITDEISEFLINEYGKPTKPTLKMVLEEYHDIMVNKGWPEINSLSTLYYHLNKPEIIQKWYGARHGVRVAREKHAYELRTKLPSHRDALWYSDGTKLNYFALDENGKVVTLMVYEVMDAFSECLLGYHISKTEDHVAQYHAYKMAIERAEAQPYQIAYDNQGGHKKMSSFFSKLAHVGFSVQPYNPKSKTIESAFGRFQRQHMRKDWFFTGQNITAKRADSSANMEFINKNRKKLPTIDQIKEIYKHRREEWNNAKHPKYNKSRLELYSESVNPRHTPVDHLQMVELFWVETKPIKYYNSGITLTIKGEKYEYEVLKDGLPDIGFRRKYIDQRFVMKYDPADLSHVRLYLPTDKGIKFITVAEPRLVVPRAVIDQNKEDKELIGKLLDIRRSEEKVMQEQADKLHDNIIVDVDDMMASMGIVYKAESMRDESERLNRNRNKDDDEQSIYDKM